MSHATGISPPPTTRHAQIIQGGMGIGVSDWRLAGAVTRQGQLGVVSGTALEAVCARRLQLGDRGGHMRWALEGLPLPGIASNLLSKYFIDGGKPTGQPFKTVSMYTMQPSRELQELSIAAAFAEVALAKRDGAGGPVGINYLYKIQMPLLASLYGAMLAGVDYVIVGAGRPTDIPEVLNRFADNRSASMALHVHYASGAGDFRMHLDPAVLLDKPPCPPKRPAFLAIVSSVGLARGLLGNGKTGPDGFVVEGHTAGGHNAPPQGKRQFDARGQPVFGREDDVDLSAMQALGRPFWVAGGYADRPALAKAVTAGATGVQVGTAFAFCEESGLNPRLKARVLEHLARGQLRVLTDPRASPTGFPFKVLECPDTLADDEVFQHRPPSCDLGMLRVPFRSEHGGIGYRCPAEAKRAYARKRGRPEHTPGRKCLCNALLANIGLGQTRSSGYREPPLLTSGTDLDCVAQLLAPGRTSYSAAEVVDRLLGRNRATEGEPAKAVRPTRR